MALRSVTLWFKHNETGETLKASYRADSLPKKIWDSEKDYHQAEVDDTIETNARRRTELIEEMKKKGYSLFSPVPSKRT